MADLPSPRPACSAMNPACDWNDRRMATGLSILMMPLLPGWTKVFAIIFLVLGGYVAGVFFGNVLIQEFACRAGLKMFARRWVEWRASNG